MSRGCRLRAGMLAAVLGAGAVVAEEAQPTQEAQEANLAPASPPQPGLPPESPSATSAPSSESAEAGRFPVRDRPAVLRGTSRPFGEKGTVEVSGMVGLSVGSIADQFTFTVNLDPYIGYFVSDRLEVGARPGFMLTVADDVQTALNLMVNPNYHFALNDWMVPFVGASVGITRGVIARLADARLAAAGFSGDVGFTGGLEAGVKVPVGSAGLVRLQAQFQTAFVEGGDLFNLNLVAGFGTYF